MRLSKLLITSLSCAFLLTTVQASADTIDVTATGVGINTSTPTFDLDVNGNAIFRDLIGIDHGNSKAINITDRQIDFIDPGISKIRNVSSGGKISLEVPGNGSGGGGVYIDANADVWVWKTLFNGSGVPYITSDIRLKEDITSVDGSLDKLKVLSAIRYVARPLQLPSGEMTTPNRQPQLGVVAQEVEQVFPELVRTSETTGYKAVAYSGFVPVLIEAVKELSARVETLEAELARK